MEPAPEAASNSMPAVGQSPPPEHRALTRLAVYGALIALVFISFAVWRRASSSNEHPVAPPPFVPEDAILVAGHRVKIGTPVVLWSDPIGFNAYSERRRFSDGILPGEEGKPPAKDASPRRFGERTTAGLDAADAAHVRAHGFDLDRLRRKIRLFVIHFDAVGSATRCFRALHDVRGLSVHFMLDLDGTIYQTLDVRERAFHAADANDDSVGVEIASIGAQPTPLLLEPWYGEDEFGIRNLFPAAFNLGVQRRADYVPRPARPELIQGQIQGRRHVQYDFTSAQYESLARLTAGLHRALPRIRLDYPRGADGRVHPAILSDAARKSFTGLVGHYHLSRTKVDPGPAFQWDHLLVEAHSAAASIESP